MKVFLDFRKVISLNSCFLSLYLCLFIRQYLWNFNGAIVWVLSGILSSVIVIIINRENFKPIRNLESKFYFIVIAPLTFFYILRFVFLDSSWDVINYHFINGERAVRGFPFLKDDFFYLSYSNPVSDMATTIFRHTLGHRLGTIINLLVR